MNSNNQTTNPYTRKTGFFGSVKKLGVTIVSGANDITTDTVGTATNITGATRQVTSIAREAVDIWGETILEDMRADQAEDRIIREMERHHRTAELDNLKTELAKVKSTNPVGRPKKS